MTLRPLARGLVAQTVLFGFSRGRSEAPLSRYDDLRRNRMLIVLVYRIMIPNLYYCIKP